MEQLDIQVIAKGIKKTIDIDAKKHLDEYCQSVCKSLDSTILNLFEKLYTSKSKKKDIVKLYDGTLNINGNVYLSICGKELGYIREHLMKHCADIENVFFTINNNSVYYIESIYVKITNLEKMIDDEIKNSGSTEILKEKYACIKNNIDHDLKKKGVYEFSTGNKHILTEDVISRLEKDNYDFEVTTIKLVNGTDVTNLKISGKKKVLTPGEP